MKNRPFPNLFAVTTCYMKARPYLVNCKQTDIRYFTAYSRLIYYMRRKCQLDYTFFNKKSIFDPRPENCLSFSKKLPPKIV